MGTLARPPVGQQCQQVEDADGATAVHIGRAFALDWAVAPRSQHYQEIQDPDVAVAVEVCGARSGVAGSIKEVCRAGGVAVVVVSNGADHGYVAAD